MIVGKVLIIDDEIAVRQGLREAITSNFPYWQVVDEAANGAEAMEKIKQFKPHLVLIDIRMPVMDGLEVAQNIYKHYRDTDIVILTGFKDFEFAQAAIRFGVREFLLKPCPEEELSRVMQSAYDLLLEKIEKRENERLKKQAIVVNTVRSLMLRLPYVANALDEVTHDYHRKQLWFIKIPSYFPATQLYRLDDISLLQYWFCNMIDELIGFHRLHAVNVPIFFDLFALFLEPDDSIAEFIEALKKESVKLLGTSIVVTDAGIVRQMKRLSAALDGFLRESGERSQESAANPNASNTFSELFAVNHTRIRTIYNRFMAKIQIGQTEGLKEILKSIIQPIRRSPLSEAKQEALALTIAMHEIMHKEFHTVDEEFDLLPQIAGLYSLENTDKVVSWIHSRSEVFQLDCMKWLQSNNQNIIGKAIRYIEDNYMNDCTLTEVAEFIHLSASYFSNLFKKETKESFINYLTKFRMDKAKVLLSNTSMKIFEIAHSIGYDDPNYFTAVFKHTQQMSPGEFRKKCIKEM
ncbi:MAG: response regulator [Paenibacillus sp.]|jgi:two-component system response regulator YesN|nr:response regulator [Paenibacillus sp.]